MSVCGQVIQCEMLPGEASKAMKARWEEKETKAEVQFQAKVYGKVLQSDPTEKLRNINYA